MPAAKPPRGRELRVQLSDATTADSRYDDTLSCTHTEPFEPDDHDISGHDAHWNEVEVGTRVLNQDGCVGHVSFFWTDDASGDELARIVYLDGEAEDLTTQDTIAATRRYDQHSGFEIIE